MARFVPKTKTAGSSCCRPFASLRGTRILPVPAVEAASAMEPTATMEARPAACDCSTAETANRSASSEARSTPSDSATAVEAFMAVESAAAIEAGASIKSAVEPRASADEETTGEIARSVVTVRSARIRSISVVAVGARRRPSHVARSNSHTDRDSLRAGVRGRRQANAK
jgi:hypothetical protein